MLHLPQYHDSILAAEGKKDKDERGFSLQHCTLTMMKKALFVMMKNAETCGLSREIKEKAAIVFILSKLSIKGLMFLYVHLPLQKN